jgi:hypothetical protein
MSENQAEDVSESSLPVFRPFTREELAVIENRISEKKLAAKKKADKLARNIAVSHKILKICSLTYYLVSCNKNWALF